MEISFTSKKLQKACNSDAELLRQYGKNCARKIRIRLDDLAAASTLQAFRPPTGLAGRCHELVGDRQGQLSLDLEHPLRLIFVPAGEGVQRKPDGGLDWNSVTAVEIIGVEDTHA